MNDSIKVSVLIPIYKVENFLEKMLDTVFTQTYSNLYYVFVNDNSPDMSLEILKRAIKKYGIDSDRYTIITHKENEGVAKSRKDCIENAKGDYIYFVDADDWIDNDAIEKMVDATKGGLVDIIGCDYIDELGNDNSLYHHENYADTCYENMVRCINYDVSPVLWKLLIRKQLFKCFSITSGIDIGEDYAITIKLFYYARSFVALNKAFYHYVHGNQLKLSYQRRRSLYDHIEIVKEVEKFLEDKKVLDEEVKNKLNLRKFNIKSNFLVKQTWDSRAYRDVFPNVNTLWRFLNYGKKEKIKFWLAEKKLFFLLKIYRIIWNSRL